MACVLATTQVATHIFLILVLLSIDLFVAVYDSCKLVISERIESDHMPV